MVAISHEGCPRVFQLTTNQLPQTSSNPQFTSQVCQEFCSTVGTKASLSSSLHPQTNGQTEPTNQELENTLCYLISSNQTTWSSQLTWMESAHNLLRQRLLSIRDLPKNIINQNTLYLFIYLYDYRYSIT